jgi:hypothetical protein
VIQCVEEVSKSHKKLGIFQGAFRCQVLDIHLSCLRRNTSLKNLLCKDLCHRLVVRALDIFSRCLFYSYQVFSLFSLSILSVALMLSASGDILERDLLPSAALNHLQGRYKGHLLCSTSHSRCLGINHDFLI